MNEKMQQYEPSPAEMRKAESMITKKQKEQSEIREDALFEGIRQGKNLLKDKSPITEKENTLLSKIDFKKIEKNKKFLIFGEKIFDESINDKIGIECTWNHEYVLSIFIKDRKDNWHEDIYLYNVDDLQEALTLIVDFSKINPEYEKIVEKVRQIDKFSRKR